MYRDNGPVPRRSDWLAWLNEPESAAELEALRASVIRGRPYGAEACDEPMDMAYETCKRRHDRPHGVGIHSIAGNVEW